jgi:uncharacterized membrane protein
LAYFADHGLRFAGLLAAIRWRRAVSTLCQIAKIAVTQTDRESIFAFSLRCILVHSPVANGRSKMSQNHLQDHIDLIAKHEQEFLARRTRAERISDSVAGFAGSLKFVTLHLVFFLGWILLNSLPATRHLRFDPAPYSLLSTIVTLEAIMLGSFILMRQSRMSRRADERDHLMLQILLLTEKEITALLGMQRQMAKHAGLTSMADRPEIKEMSRHTSIEDVAQTIKEALPPLE